LLKVCLLKDKLRFLKWISASLTRFLKCARSGSELSKLVLVRFTLSKLVLVLVRLTLSKLVLVLKTALSGRGQLVLVLVLVLVMMLLLVLVLVGLHLVLVLVLVLMLVLVLVGPQRAL